MSTLKSFTVTFQEILRVRVCVEAVNEQHARAKAVTQWSKDLWDTAEPALLPTSSEIIESCNRDFFEIEEDPFAKPSTNESTHHG